MRLIKDTVVESRSPVEAIAKHNVDVILARRVDKVVEQTIASSFKNFFTVPGNRRVFLASIIENSFNNFRNASDPWWDMLEKLNTRSDFSEYRLEQNEKGFKILADWVRNGATSIEIQTLYTRMIYFTTSQRILIEQVTIEVAHSLDHIAKKLLKDNNLLITLDSSGELSVILSKKFREVLTEKYNLLSTPIAHQPETMARPGTIRSRNTLYRKDPRAFISNDVDDVIFRVVRQL